jgi:N-acyl-D-aspartate/D-glutamate deacylase
VSRTSPTSSCARACLELAELPEYLDALAARRCDIDFATQVPHAPLRVFVMGRRGVDREPATAQDMAAMATLVEEGLAAGALGFSTSRSLFHRTPDGVLTPTITAAEEELTAIARGMRRAGRGVIQLLDDFADTTDAGSTEFAMLRRLVEASGGRFPSPCSTSRSIPAAGRPCCARSSAPTATACRSRARSRRVRSRCCTGWSCRSIRSRPARATRGHRSAARGEAQEAARSGDAREADRREPTYPNPQMLAFMRSVENMYVLGDPPNYTPPRDQRLDVRAAALGVTPLELAYDLLVSGDGRTILFHPGANYTDASMPTWPACSGTSTP